MEFNQAVVTTKGQALMAKLLAGATTKFTKVATSSTVYQQSQLEGLTALTNVKQTVVPTSYENNATTVKVVAAINNEGLADAYYLNTVGLYATDSDGSEILYSVAIATVAAYIPPDTGVSKTGIELKIYTAVSNASSVDLTVDPSAVATISDIAAVNENLTNMFPGGANILRNTNTGLAISGSRWATGAWQMGGDGTATHGVFDVSDAPNPDICKALYLDKTELNSDRLIGQTIIPLPTGVEYTISCYARCASGDPYMKFQVGVSTALGGTGWKVNERQITSDWERYSLTFTDENTNMYAFFGMGTLRVGRIEICGMKLEVGNKATDWCPSPWDMVTKAEYNALADRVAALEAR